MSGRSLVFSGMCVFLAAGCASRTAAPEAPNTPPTIRILRVLPQFGFAGGALRVTWLIERDDRNRAWCMDIGTWRSSCETMDGANARRTFQQTYENVPEGRHVVTLSVEDDLGRLHYARTDVCFNGHDTSCGAPAGESDDPRPGDGSDQP